MIHPYPEFYVYDVQCRLGIVVDYLATCCHLSFSEIDKILERSKYLSFLCYGHPSYSAGKSGIEIAYLVKEEFNLTEYAEYQFTLECNCYYWAGYFLAYYSWYKCKSLSYIFYSVSIEKVLRMYNVYHEMDIMHFVEDFDEIVSHGLKETNLKLIRMFNNLSQSQLAKKSNVSLRSIQLYEQRVNDINKAQSQSLFRLAKVLHCNMLDLMEIDRLHN